MFENYCIPEEICDHGNQSLTLPIPSIVFLQCFVIKIMVAKMTSMSTLGQLPFFNFKHNMLSLTIILSISNIFK